MKYVISMGYDVSIYLKRDCMSISKLLLKSVLLYFIVFQVYAEGQSNQFYRYLWQPYFRTQRLAFCEDNGGHCGRYVANQYCRLMVVP